MWAPSYVQHVEVPGRDGYHLNAAMSLLTPALEPYRVTPADPLCRWAGDEETLFLRFDDKTEARAVMGEHWIADAN